MEIAASLITLTVLEIVLGIDNIIFISILSSKLPKEQQAKARQLGLILAMGLRIMLLLSLQWMMNLTRPLFELPFGFLGDETRGISGRDLILLSGGLFLIYKSTSEIHHKLEGNSDLPASSIKTVTFTSVIVQILLLDIVFSLDSVITAIGMADRVWVMITAIVIAVGVMMVSMHSISSFVERHPTIKILALSFLLLIGVSLLMEGLDQGIPKGYIYFAMAFSVFVELLNIKVLKNQSKPSESQIRRRI
ncbi:MAG: TerC family protein [Thermaurantimonas sp.]